MTEESPPEGLPEQQPKPKPRELYSKVSRALLSAGGGRARKRRALRRARGSESQLLALAEAHGEKVSLPDS